jgi:hypothetical protein
MEPITLPQVVDCPGATIRNDASATQRSYSDPHAKSSRWADLPSTAIRARSHGALGSNLKLAASVNFPVRMRAAQANQRDSTGQSGLDLV